jgi:hypothetical protein
MFAEETKEVSLYSYSDKGVFTSELKYLWVIGTGIASSSTLEKPLKEKEGFVSVWNGSTWEYKENHLGKTIYSTETKESKTVDYVGEIQQGWTLLEPIEFGTWDGTAWVDVRTPEQIAEYKRSIMLTLTPIEFDLKLDAYGLYDAVQDLIKSNRTLAIAYNRATFFSRTDPFIDQARIALNLTDAQVDAMWVG